MLSIIYRYYSNVRKAKADVRYLISEIKTYINVLAFVRELTDNVYKLFSGVLARAPAVEESLGDF